MSICEIIIEFSQDYTEMGSHKVSEHFHGGLYSFVLCSGFDPLELRLPHAERSFYLLTITIGSHLGVLVSSCNVGFFLACSKQFSSPFFLSKLKIDELII